MLTIRYFASLRESLGCEEESVSLAQDKDMTVTGLVDQLSSRGAGRREPIDLPSLSDVAGR